MDDTSAACRVFDDEHDIAHGRQAVVLGEVGHRRHLVCRHFSHVALVRVVDDLKYRIKWNWYKHVCSIHSKNLKWICILFTFLREFGEMIWLIRIWGWGRVATAKFICVISNEPKLSKFAFWLSTKKRFLNFVEIGIHMHLKKTHSSLFYVFFSFIRFGLLNGKIVPGYYF